MWNGFLMTILAIILAASGCGWYIHNYWQELEAIALEILESGTMPEMQHPSKEINE